MSNTPTAEEFLRALPPVLRNDRRMMALGQVVAEELSDRMSEIEKAAIYPRIDELDEALLDILAYDFKVDWYGYDYPLETKRALLKSSFYIHRHLGTKGAVEAAIQSVYPKSIVEEWFDYALSVITSYRGLFKDVTSDAFLEKMLDEFVLSRPALEA